MNDKLYFALAICLSLTFCLLMACKKPQVQRSIEWGLCFESDGKTVKEVNCE